VEVGRRKEEGGSRKEEGGRRKEEQGARHKTQDTRLTTRDTGIGVQSSSDNDAHWDCDEWDVVVADGTALRLACNRATGEWTVEGMLD
jgi:hypothetical protein